MMNMGILFQIRDSLTPEFKLLNCADAACTIMQRSVAQFKSLKRAFVHE